MYICILGRQPALGMAELERLYSSNATKWFSGESALIDHDDFDFNQLGGSLKAGRVVAELQGNWQDISKALVNEYAMAWAGTTHKITLGISAYGFNNIGPRDVQKTGLVLKQRLKKEGVNVRLVPNDFAALNTATSHHNKLGLSENKVELLVVRSGNGKVVVAQSVGAQNITAIAARDQARPHTDAFVGMLPPKLARIMVNMVGPVSGSPTLLDPFCGTGVVLQEALLSGYSAYGSDLSDKMVDYTTKNLAWLSAKYGLTAANYKVNQADAMDARWQVPISTVVTETYLGQPFSAPPKPAKLTEVRGNCNHIISQFLRNLAPQIAPGTVLVIAVPAWRSTTGEFTHLPLTGSLSSLGYKRIELANVAPDRLMYYRETQVVARELLLLAKA